MRAQPSRGSGSYPETLRRPPGRYLAKDAALLPARLLTRRLVLDPLTPDHADAMSLALSDAALYAFIGGAPPSADELRARYTRLVAGAAASSGERWLNWVLRLDDDLVGYVQATVKDATAHLAWVVGAPWQGRGLAVEAAAAMRDWLAAQGVDHFVAAIHPDHAASSAVARRLGFIATSERLDGEVIWRLTRP
jgi:RimJ/RimL family protein N-acetyltransferase